MSSNSTLSPAQLKAGENSLYVGINLEDILYGIGLSLYIQTMHVFFTRRGAARRSDVFYAIFSTVMLLLVTIWVATVAIFGQQMWILHRDFPGGPAVYAMAHASDIYLGVGGAAAVILQLMTDGLMIHRCRLVWDSRRVIIVPSILWLASLALGIMVLWVARKAGKDFYSGFSAKIGLSYYSVSVFLTASLTSMIIYRLLRYGRRVKESLGNQFASPYFTVITLLVESVLPYTLAGIALLVAYAVASEAEIALSRVYTVMMCVSPQMLILRVAEGSAWDKETSRPGPPLSTLRFSPGGRSGGDEGGTDGGRPQTGARFARFDYK